MGLARLLFGQSRYLDAISLLPEALHGIKPRRSDVLLGMGRRYERLDRAEKALEAYEKVLRLDPRIPMPSSTAAACCVNWAEPKKPSAPGGTAASAAPPEPDGWYEIVFMLATAEQRHRGTCRTRPGRSLLPATPAAWIRLGQAAPRRGQFDERAVSFFEKAVASPRQRGPSRHARSALSPGAASSMEHFTSCSRAAGQAAGRRSSAPAGRDRPRGLNAINVDQLALEKAAQTCGELLVPEALFSRVRELADSEVAAYVPVPRRVIAIRSVAGRRRR